MKNYVLKTTGLALAVLVVGASMASANIVYVDAAESNTTLADGTAYTPPARDDADDQWTIRVVGNGATSYTANDNNANPGEDAPELRTTITGLTDGQEYNLYAYFWAATPSGNGDWDLAAGFALDALTAYKPTLLNATDISGVTVADHFTVGTVMVVESDRELYQADLGSVVVGSSESISIYLDDVTGNDDRSWYDGVGYEAIPEPATLGMVALFGGGLLVIRRRLMI